MRLVKFFKEIMQLEPRPDSPNIAANGRYKISEKKPRATARGFDSGETQSSAESCSDCQVVLCDEVGCRYFFPVFVLDFYHLNTPALCGNEKTARTNL